MGVCGSKPRGCGMGIRRKNPTRKRLVVRKTSSLSHKLNQVDSSVSIDRSYCNPTYQVNVIKFNARGLNLLNGKLTIEAAFKVSSKSRVDISYRSSTITPDQLMNLFRKNYDILLGIFNPEGWLEITYVDAVLRIGRDDKGNIFILERSEDNQ